MQHEQKEEEIAYFTHHLGLSRDQVLAAIAAVGTDRKALEKYFRDHPPAG